MNGSNENFKEPLGDWLKNSFDQYELNPRPSLRKRVFSRLPNRGKRIFQTASGLLLAVLLALYFVDTDKNEIVASASGGKSSASQHSLPVRKSVRASAKKVTIYKSMPVGSRGRAFKAINLFTSRQVHTSTSTDKMITKQEQTLKSEPQTGNTSVSFPATFSQTLLASLPANPPKPLETSLPVWPEIFPDTITRAPVRKKNATRWFLSAMPSQNFQTLYVRSNAQMVFENIRFAGLSSIQSKGIKIAGGMERWGFKGSIAYTFLQYQTRFDIGGPKFAMEQTGPDQYKITRENTSANEMRQDLHFIGLGIARQFDFKAPALRPYSATFGVEYTRSVSDNQGLALANASFVHKLHLSAPFQLSVGPFAEVGLNNLRIKSLGWYYRPYQVGVSLTFSGVINQK